MEKNKL